MAARLRAVDEVAHRVEVEHDFARVPGQTPRAHRQQAVGDGHGIMGEFVTARGLVVGKFQPVEGRGRGQGRAAKGRIEAVQPQRIEFVARRGQQRIAAQEGVVIEVLISQRQPVEPLGQQLGQRMIDEAGVARVVETGGQCAGQPQAMIPLAEQERTPVAGKIPGGKVGHDLAGTEVGKEQRLVDTVCRRSGGGA